ncbi:rhodanese-like domain-containing protein [Streptomyces lunaelactis]|uniref:rhodanese-like domain-containing protein n=1 Tax=Streptomyces lunaelactis TaxID=1535768 RepID=UPI0028152538|nr:rhodanese-like domain-containing protein [Streptomyces lunaelactis]
MERGHAPGAVHRSLTELSDGAPLPPEDRGQRLIVICRSGNRSRQAAALLTAGGVDAVDVSGGMREWAEGGTASGCSAGGGRHSPGQRAAPVPPAAEPGPARR